MRALPKHIRTRYTVTMVQYPRVLIIEDDPDQIMIYKDRFEKDGFYVSVAETAEKGIARAKEEGPDVIMLDIRLQSKNEGLNVLRTLKKDAETSDIPVFIFTNFGKKAFEKESLESGAERYIVKTDMSPKEISALVRDALGVDEKHVPKPRSEKILLIEDDETHRQMYVTKFTSAGFPITAAVNGEEGLKKARSERPDFILLDLAMPMLSGKDVLEQLKTDPKTKNIPVAILSAVPRNTLTDEARALFNTHTKAYIEKPRHSPTEVVTIVEDLLSSSK